MRNDQEDLLREIAEQEITALRAEQDDRVRPLVPQLLDEWDQFPGDLQGQIQEERPHFASLMKRLNAALEGEVSGG